MKVVRFLYRLAGHVGLICGIAILVIQVLDWYNPYMDFMGHARFLLYGLCISAIWVGICGILGLPVEKQEKPGKRRQNYGRGQYTNLFSKK